MKQIYKLTVITFLLTLLIVVFSTVNSKAAQLTAEDFLKTDNKVIRNHSGTGSTIILRGVNAGGLFVQELWMCPTKSESGIEDQKTIEDTLVSRFGETQAQELLNTYYDNFWTESDFDRCQEMGMNVIRLPLWYRNFTDDFGNVREDAFERIDWFVEESGKRGMYVIIDMHGAPGSQNDKDHSGDINSNKALWQGPDAMANQNLFIKIWKMIAEHYEGNPVVAAYDLLNESECAAGAYTDEQTWGLYDKAYDAIRAIDKDHIIIMGATWEAYNLPRPETYGWENVIYEYHSYNYDDTTDADAQATFLENKLRGILRVNHNVPSYIGETSFFSNMESWERCLKILDDYKFSWTLWNYKVTGDGTNTWGLYNTNVSKPSIVSDSYETIKRKWSNIQTSETYKNTEVCDIVERFISYTPSATLIGDATVSSISSQGYTGREIKPFITVSYKGTKLINNVDYTLTYSNNIHCGKATISITGMGKYEGVKKVTFNILPEAISNFRAILLTETTMNLTWKKSINADGYYIYQYKSGKYKQIGKIKSFSNVYKIKKLKAGTSYKFRICSYVDIDSKEYLGAITNLKVSTKVGKPNIKKSKNKITWKRVNGAKGYAVYAATKRKGKYKKLKNITSSKNKNSYKLKKSGTYFVKVRAYSKINGKNVYGKYSKIIRVSN